MNTLLAILPLLDPATIATFAQVALRAVRTCQRIGNGGDGVGAHGAVSGRGKR